LYLPALRADIQIEQKWVSVKLGPHSNQKSCSYVAPTNPERNAAIRFRVDLAIRALERDLLTDWRLGYVEMGAETLV
jgi:hypothetical protein